MQNEDKNQQAKTVLNIEYKARTLDLSACSRKYKRARDSFSFRPRK